VGPGDREEGENMAKFSRRSRITADMVGESSMSDVAFLLLIFFIVSTTFPEVGLTLILPSKSGEVKEVARTNVMQIVTARTGSYFVGTEETPTPLNRIKPRVKERLLENDKLIVSLETHPEAPYGKMIDALDEVVLAYNELDAAGTERTRRISLKMIGVQQ
jgi:biopolymer transport protein ExbD